MTRQDVQPARAAEVRTGGVPWTRFPSLTTDSGLTRVLAALALVLGATVFFYGYVQPQTPVRLDTNAARLIPMSPFWSWVTRLPLPVPRSAIPLALTIAVVGIVAFLAYGSAVAACWNRPSSRRTLIAVTLPAVAFMVMTAVALPTHTTDIHDYILIGRLGAVHDSNPLLVPTGAFPDDPNFAFVTGRWTVEPEAKGPVWTAITTGFAAVAGEDPPTIVLVYRLGFLAFNLANLALVVTFLRRWRPQHVLAGTVLYGWSPIVVTHGVEKTDTIMVFFMLAGLWLLFSGRRLPAVAALGASVMVKILTLPLLVAHFVRELAARRWRSVIGGGLVLLLVIALAYAPFSTDPGVVLNQLLRATEARESPSTLPALAYLVFTVIGAGLVIAAGIVGRRGNDEWLRANATVALFFGAFLYPNLRVWYLIASIALVALDGSRPLAIIGGMLWFVGFQFNVWSRSTSANIPLPRIQDVIPIPVLFLGALLLIGAGTLTLLLLYRSRWRTAGIRAGR